MNNHFIELIQHALHQLRQEGALPASPQPPVKLERTRDASHGDFASNIALMLAKPAGMPPRELAEKIVAALPQSEQVAKVEIAGHGFINFFQSDDVLRLALETMQITEKIGVKVRNSDVERQL